MGNDVLSSLWAAAGGVTVELRRRNDRIGRGVKKRQSPDVNKAGKQEADMR
jgi:hypothetical protein